MDKKLIIENIASRSWCALKDFKDIAYHELRHMGISPEDFDKEINEYVTEEENNIRGLNQKDKV